MWNVWDIKRDRIVKKIEEPAEWDLKMWVYCPYCEEYQEVEWSEVPDYFEKFELLSTQEDIKIIHKCDNRECEKEFIIDKTIW